MNTVITLYDSPDEWYQSTFICCECKNEFMTDHEIVPRFCPYCGVKFDAVRIKYGIEHGNRTETGFIKEEENEVPISNSNNS